ncbi:hypothetical protein CJ030_MR2G020034 [Morella rubra]|uniref:Uncharacterized protein n=1 Tax=Morella rubra TaxID=262757 RepID=A0A6A1WDP9_9ROSI|nr:hypothetical protein CJ030_MR2G020034 [Morella rubra]
MDYSGASNNDLPHTLMGPTDTVVLLESSSLGHSNLLGAGVDSEVHSKMLPTSEVPLVISSGAEVPPSQQSSVLGASIASGSRLPLVPSASDKELAMSLVDESASESSEESGPPIQSDLDVSELAYNTKLESACSRSLGLEIELEAEKKRSSKLRTVARCTHSQAEIFGARVEAL